MNKQKGGNSQMHDMRSFFFPIFVGLMYLFLYVPIGVLMVFSFNDNAFTYHWKGFTYHWYYDLFSSIEVWDALQNSLIVAGTSVILSLVMGSLLVFFGTRKYTQKLLILFYGSLAMPEIVLAVGMLIFFSFFSIPLGLTSLIAGHTLIGLGYSVPIIYARYANLDVSLLEASYDLGATQMQTFFSIVLPMIMSALVAAGLLVFIISLDDFIISFFCAGASTQTLPLYIFSMIRAGATPVVNALSTLLLIASSFLVLIFSLLQGRRMRMMR